MNKFIIDLPGKKIKDILFQLFNEYSEEIELLEAFKHNTELMNYLITYQSFSMSLFKTCIEKNQSSWLKEIWLHSHVQEEFKQYIHSLSSSIEEEKVPLLLKEVVKIHEYQTNLNQNETYYHTKPRILKSKEWLAEKMIEKIISDSQEKSTSSDYINQYVKEFESPVFFNLLNFFKINPVEISSLSNINWELTDNKGNTVFHHLYKYDESLYDALLIVMNNGQYGNYKNDQGKTPFQVWSDEVFNNKNNNLSLLTHVCQSNMSWDDKQDQLLYILKQVITRHAKEEDEEKIQKINELLVSMVSIPEFKKNTKIRGYLNGIVNFSGKQNDKINSIQKIFTHIQLEEELINNHSSSSRYKI